MLGSRQCFFFRCLTSHWISKHSFYLHGSHLCNFNERMLDVFFLYVMFSMALVVKLKNTKCRYWFLKTIMWAVNHFLCFQRQIWLIFKQTTQLRRMSIIPGRTCDVTHVIFSLFWLFITPFSSEYRWSVSDHFGSVPCKLSPH